MSGIYDLTSSLHPLRHAHSNPLLINSSWSSSTTSLTSTSSFWSDVSSQHSDDSTSTSDSDSCYFSRAPSSSQQSVSSLGSIYEPAVKLHDPWVRQPACTQPQVEAPPELRQNPRRTNNSVTSRTGRPPSLVRQDDRKVNFVDNLVGKLSTGSHQPGCCPGLTLSDTSTHIVEAIWPTSSVPPRNENGTGSVLPLRTFIQETLRRSRTSYSTLQVALYYLILIKPHVPTHDFTTEQPDDRYSSQAIQCGRRMFLAALILASKYLQDRNYSARAWSKISGLNTQEINKNEMTFLLAVNWKLHVTEEVYKRWCECVAKLTPSQPPSPGGVSMQVYEQQCYNFRRIILGLSPDLSNLEELLAPWSSTLTYLREPSPRTVRRIPSAERFSTFGSDMEQSWSPKSRSVPVVLEPTPANTCAPSRFAPALGLLPTPRLASQPTGLITPAASVVSQVPSRSSSMAFAMAQASASAAAQSADRWPASMGSSPLAPVTRRSSLANSVCSASSPESMISDSSKVSRSSSVSSASSAGAPSSNLDSQARYRTSKSNYDRLGPRLPMKPVYEDNEPICLTSSPEEYGVAVGQEMCDLTLNMLMPCPQREMDNAARTLQNMQQNSSNSPVIGVKAGLKRSRPFSVEDTLQDDVRDILAGRYGSARSWSETMVRSRPDGTRVPQQVPVRISTPGSHKRLCCSAEASQILQIPSLHPAVSGLGGPGMWEGILN